MAWFEQSGSRIYFEESGSGDPVLLLPGWGGTIDEFGPLREALAQKFRVIAADLPGSGKSDPQPREYTPSYFQDDAPVFLAMLEATGASPAHLIGFSDGGEYALLMAAMQPKCARSIITWGAGGELANIPQMADAMLNMVDSPIPPMKEFSEHMKATYGEANARVMTRSFGAALRAIMEGGCDISRSRAANISCPALLITGENDMFAPPALVREMAKAIVGGEFLEAKGASHPVHQEQPEWLAHTITDWLSRR